MNVICPENLVPGSPLGGEKKKLLEYQRCERLYGASAILVHLYVVAWNDERLERAQILGAKV